MIIFYDLWLYSLDLENSAKYIWSTMPIARWVSILGLSSTQNTKTFLIFTCKCFFLCNLFINLKLMLGLSVFWLTGEELSKINWGFIFNKSLTTVGLWPCTHLLAVRDGGLLGDPARRRAEGGPQLRRQSGLCNTPHTHLKNEWNNSSSSVIVLNAPANNIDNNGRLVPTLELVEVKDYSWREKHHIIVDTDENIVGANLQSWVLFTEKITSHES